MGSDEMLEPLPLDGRIALVAGATRGAGRGIATMLGAAGATVICTGRTTRQYRSPMNRPETIEETAKMLAINPFADISAALPANAMQIYLVLAVLAPGLLRELKAVLQAQRRRLGSSELESVDEPDPNLLGPLR